MGGQEGLLKQVVPELRPVWREGASQGRTWGSSAEQCSASQITVRELGTLQEEQEDQRGWDREAGTPARRVLSAWEGVRVLLYVPRQVSVGGLLKTPLLVIRAAYAM